MFRGSSIQRHVLYKVAGEVLQSAPGEAPLQPLHPSPDLYPPIWLLDMLTRAIVITGLHSRGSFLNRDPTSSGRDGHQQQVESRRHHLIRIVAYAIPI